MTQNRPFVEDLDTPLPSPAAAPAPADPVPQLAPALPIRLPGFRWGRLFWSALGGLVAFALGLWVWDFVTGLLLRNPALGAIALGLGAVVALAGIVLALRETLAFARLGRIDGLRQRAALALADQDIAAARAVSAELQRLYAGRADMAWGLGRLRDEGRELIDADLVLGLAEETLLGPADQAARREIEAAARLVATVTALVPLALADVAAALLANLRMIRAIATIYGGRAGMFGSWRLLSRVMQHLVATGAVAVGDDLISSVAGGGVVGKLSRRFGEGVVNGALTVRVGIAAMEVCRPLPFVRLDRPRTANVMGRALAGIFGR
jgi:putative membrane protein